MFLPGSKNVLMEYMMRNRNNPLGVVRGGVDVMQSMASGLQPNAQAAKQTAMPAPAQPEQKKPGFLQGNGVFGIPKEALFMGGAGLLAGNRHNGAQLALQGFAGGMQSARQRQEQAKQQAKMDKFKEGLTPEQAMLFDVAPQAVAQGMAGRMFAEPAGPEYFKSGDDIIGVHNGQSSVIYDAPDAAPVPDWQRTTIQRDGGSYIVEYDRAAENPQSTIRVIGQEPTEPGDTESGRPELSDVRPLREAFNRQAREFEESQRNYLTMERLAQDDTGASDVALGFAFFKTIDPSSTVREGEFAQAATSMGLGGQIISYFKGLDSGIKFGPTLRKELVRAAGHAYQQQVQDIESAYQRNIDLANYYEIDPSLIAYDPVRQSEGGNTGPVTQANQFPNAPPIGSVEDGFVYMGGPPNNPSSWEPAS